MSSIQNESPAGASEKDIVEVNRLRKNIITKHHALTCNIMISEQLLGKLLLPTTEPLKQLVGDNKEMVAETVKEENKAEKSKFE